MRLNMMDLEPLSRCEHLATEHTLPLVGLFVELFLVGSPVGLCLELLVTAGAWVEDFRSHVCC